MDTPREQKRDELAAALVIFHEFCGEDCELAVKTLDDLAWFYDEQRTSMVSAEAPRTTSS